MIEFKDMTKRYGDVVAVDGVSFQAPPGRITGFLGPNGAGKTTSLKVLLGLAQATAGEALIDGRRYQDWENPGRTIGGMITADAFHPGRSGRESLILACQMLRLPASRADEVLDEVGLSRHEGRKRVGTYSLGMRQRLALGQALLGDPSVLVCDEPTNGLDPQGQRWLADLLIARAARGCTVLLSSHNLADVERIADRVVILAGGRLVVADTVAALRETHGDLADYYFGCTVGADRTTHENRTTQENRKTQEKVA